MGAGGETFALARDRGPSVRARINQEYRIVRAEGQRGPWKVTITATTTPWRKRAGRRSSRFSGIRQGRVHFLIPTFISDMRQRSAEPSSRALTFRRGEWPWNRFSDLLSKHSSCDRAEPTGAMSCSGLVAGLNSGGRGSSCRGRI
jgi:hypothetical protein